MFHRPIKYLIIILSVSCLTMITGCAHPTPESQSDDTKLTLYETVDSIKSGLPFAINRVEEWRDTMHLNFINAGFIGKNQIKDRKGTISYFFYEEDVTKKLDANAEVIIHINNNFSISI